MHFLVFGGRKWENVVGKKGITWEPVGVFDAEDADTACLVAAQKSGHPTCFAVAGYAWGVDTVDAGDVPELGGQVDPMTRLERMGNNIADSLSKVMASLPAPQTRELEEGDNEDGG